MRIVIALCIVTMLSACGFHLKGMQNSATILYVRSWQVDGGALQLDLERSIQKHGGVIHAHAPAQLKVVHHDFKKDIYTITRAAKLNEYLLSLHVVAQAYRNGQPWGEMFEIHVSRAFPYSDSVVLGKHEEEQLIWQELQTDAAEQIVEKLSFLPRK